MRILRAWAWPQGAPPGGRWPGGDAARRILRLVRAVGPPGGRPSHAARPSAAPRAVVAFGGGGVAAGDPLDPPRWAAAGSGRVAHGLVPAGGVVRGGEPRGAGRSADRLRRGPQIPGPRGDRR